MDTQPVLNVRIDADTRYRIVHAARLRGLNVAEYLKALVDMHDAVRARADAGDDALSAELESRGLQTVSG